MQRAVLAFVVLLSMLAGTVSAAPVGTQPAFCTGYDAWEWAQLVYESAPDQYAALDPDGNGDVCPNLPHGGFAPAIWTDAIPDDAQEARIVREIDADTFEVTIDGVSSRVRIYRADAPETQNEHQCGGNEASAFADYALSFNDTPGTVYLEQDGDDARDRYGRKLAYVWFSIDGHPYMLNHILIATGWAEDVDYGDHAYDQQLKTAADLAQAHQIGVYDQCGAFGLPLGAASSDMNTSENNLQSNLANAPATGQPSEAPSGQCDPNYTPCIPAYPPDVNCGDIGVAVTVIGSDPHGLDRDHDGVGCEAS